MSGFLHGSSSFPKGGRGYGRLKLETKECNSSGYLWPIQSSLWVMQAKNSEMLYAMNVVPKPSNVILHIVSVPQKDKLKLPPLQLRMGRVE